MGGRGVINSEKWADVVYGWPLTHIFEFGKKMSSEMQRKNKDNLIEVASINDVKF